MVYPRGKKDKIQKELERVELIEFAKKGGVPKNAPHCYGAFFQDKTKRQNRHCNTCDEMLQEMCRIRGEQLREIFEENKIEYEKTKHVIEIEYALRAEGKLTSAQFERLKRRV